MYGFLQYNLLVFLFFLFLFFIFSSFTFTARNRRQMSISSRWPTGCFLNHPMEFLQQRFAFKVLLGLWNFARNTSVTLVFSEINPQAWGKLSKFRLWWRGYTSLHWEYYSTSSPTHRAQTGSKYINRIAVVPTVESLKKVAILLKHFLPVLCMECWTRCRGGLLT